MKRIYPFSEEEIKAQQQERLGKSASQQHASSCVVIDQTMKRTKYEANFSQNFVQIPDEVLTHVFFHFFDAYWLFSVGRLVCREWNQLITKQMDQLELDLCFSGEEISDSFVKSAQSGVFSHCISDLSLLHIEDPIYVIKHQNSKAKDFKDVMRGEINRNTKKISTIALVNYFNNVEYLNLRSNRIGKDGALMLGTFDLKKLKVLDLSGSHEAPNVGKEGFLQLTSINWDVAFPNLKKLSLSHNRLDGGSMIALISCDTFPSLEALDLFGNKLDNAAIEWLVASERVLSNLTELNIGYNEYYEEAAQFIANTPHLKNLVNLNMAGKMSYNHGDKNIGDIGVYAIFNSVNIVNLTSINLSNNSVTDEGARFIFKSNKLNNLTKINLNSNQITSRGASYLAQSKCLQNLKYLFLSFNLIESYGSKAICQHLKNLKELYLRGNRIHNLGAKEISESVNLKNIEFLDISLNRFGLEGLTHLVDSKTLPSHIKTGFQDQLTLISKDYVGNIYHGEEESPSIIEIEH